MNIFKKEPKYIHGQTPNIGVLLINLGTPTTYKTSDIRKYLKEFLSDHRVVEIPKFIWWFILRGIILPFRSRKSAQKYKTIWTDNGSPLLINIKNQSSALEKLFYNYENNIKNLNPSNIKIKYAMRYNTPNIKKVLYELKQENISHLIILPLYPQYCSSTTGSTLDCVFDELKAWRVIPSIRTINHYHDNPEYIQALAIQVRQSWHIYGIPNFKHNDKLLISFHGVPQRSLELGDYYHCQCYKTARLLANELNLTEQDYIVSFQSRLGKAKWLEPYTDVTLQKLAKNNVRVDVICPGFSSDCLETLEEIAIEGKETFLSSGGREFNYIPCLNDSKHGMQAIYKIVLDNMYDIHMPSLQELQDSKEAYSKVK